MTMNGSWGYHRTDDAWKTPKQALNYLITCARDGGNYLLNIGPKPDGSIPEESISILGTVGEWMDKYGHTIYGAEPCDVKSSLFSNFTRKENTLYVHVQYWAGERWGIGGLQTEVKSVKLLPGGEPVEFEQDEYRLLLRGLPAEAPDNPITVLEVECASTPKQDMLPVRKNKPRG